MRDNTKGRSSLKNLWLFFAAAFGWTWLFWIIAILTDQSVSTPVGGSLMLLGVTGPLVAGITFTYLTKDKEGRRDYWKRIISFKRISLGWYLVILLLVPVLNVVAALIDVLLGGTGATWGEAALGFVVNPFSVVLSILFATLIPFIEELGWRGYALDLLQSKWNAFTSSLILGVIWAIWHFPLFLVPDTYQYGLGLWTWNFWLFMVGIVPLTFAFTWVYNNTRRSILAVILLHGMVNFTGELIAVTPRADTLAIGLWFVVMAAIVLIWGARSMTRRSTATPAAA